MEKITLGGLPRADRGRDPGELAAKAFSLFAAATSVEAVVAALSADPDAVLRLHDKWMQCRQRMAFWLTAETPAAAPGPSFDHPPNPSWDCCPGHQAMRNMERR